MNNTKILVCDLETTSLKVDEAQIKIFGAYDPQLDKYFIYKWSEETIIKVMALFETYDKLVTFNGEKYDLPILELHGIPVKNYKHIDVYRIYKTKGKYIRDGGFESNSLKNLILALGLDAVGKGDIDYEIFKRECWTPAECDCIIKYCKQDLLSTWKLFKHALEKLDYLKQFIAQKDIDADAHLILRDDAFLYKSLCHISKIPELYDERPNYMDFPKPITSVPRKNKADMVIVIRVPPIYAFTISQFNLLEYNCKCCPANINEGKYHGRNHFVIKGYYCQRKQGNIEQVLENIYKLAINNPDYIRYAQMVFNNLYQVITNAKYYSFYNIEAVTDCDRLIRSQLKTFDKALGDKEYKVIYMDGGEIFLLLDVEKGQTVPKALEIINDEIAKIQTFMPFPSLTYKAKFVQQLEWMEFFDKGTDTPFMYKDKYVAMQMDGKILSIGATKVEVENILLRRRKEIILKVENER